jgi:hypothetical protein
LAFSYLAKATVEDGCEFYAVYDLPETLAELNPLIDSF